MSEQCPHIVGMSWCEQCAEEHIAELEQRLEIDPRHNTDGIEARDETIKGLEAVIAELTEYLHEIYHIDKRGTDEVYDDWQAMCDVGGVIARYMKSRVKPEREIIYPDEIPVDRAGREMYNRYGDKLDIEDRE